MDVVSNFMPGGEGRQCDGLGPMHGRHVAASVEIFKKSPIGADLQPRGRDVAQHRFQITAIPLLTWMYPKPGSPQGELITLAARSAVENMRTVNTTHHRAAAPCADVPDLDADLVSVRSGEGIPDGNLTDAGPVARKSERRFRATNIPDHSGAAIHCGGACENQYYAAI